MVAQRWGVERDCSGTQETTVTFGALVILVISRVSVSIKTHPTVSS